MTSYTERLRIRRIRQEKRKDRVVRYIKQHPNTITPHEAESYIRYGNTCRLSSLISEWEQSMGYTEEATKDVAHA